MRSGVNYDTGLLAAGQPTRAEFDPDLAAAELAVIATELHADSVRITGDDLERIQIATRLAHAQGLGVWFSPFLADVDHATLLDRLDEAATLAAAAAATGPIVLVLGCEITLHCQGYLPGDDLFSRLTALQGRDQAALRTAAEHLTQTLHAAVSRARRRFAGDLTYAAGAWEYVDWSRFDRVAVNLYRDADNATTYDQELRALQQYHRPIAITEYGCATFAGAAERGSAGWLALDPTAPTLQVAPGIVRDEAEQATYLQQTWQAQRAAGVADSFWFTFCSYWCHDDPDPTRDLDCLSFGLVRLRLQPAADGLPWERKAAFHTAAQLWGADN